MVEEVTIVTVSDVHFLSNGRFAPHRYDDHDGSSDDLHAASSKLEWREEEQASLRRSLRALQTQLANERAGREEAEREADVLANENAALERQLDLMEGCRVSGILRLRHVGA